MLRFRITLSRHPATQSREQRNDKQLPAAASQLKRGGKQQARAVPNVTAARMMIYLTIGLELIQVSLWPLGINGVTDLELGACETSDVSACVLPRHPRTFSCFSCELSASKAPCAFKVLPGSPVHFSCPVEYGRPCVSRFRTALLLHLEAEVWSSNEPFTFSYPILHTIRLLLYSFSICLSK